MREVEAGFDEFDEAEELPEAVEEYRDPLPQYSPTELMLEALAVRDVLTQVVERIPSLLGTFPPVTGQRVLRALGKTEKRLRQPAASDGEAGTTAGEWALAQAMYSSSIVNADRVAFQVLIAPARDLGVLQQCSQLRNQTSEVPVGHADNDVALFHEPVEMRCDLGGLGENFGDLSAPLQLRRDGGNVERRHGVLVFRVSAGVRNVLENHDVGGIKALPILALKKATSAGIRARLKYRDKTTSGIALSQPVQCYAHGRWMMGEVFDERPTMSFGDDVLPPTNTRK